MPKFRDWLDDRTGYREIFSARRAAIVPGGPSWGRTLGPCALTLAAVEVVTGLVLMITFAPSTSSAWASIHFIDQIPLGGFLRGLHYWAGQALIVVLALYMLRALLVASFRAPRELAWITGLFLLPLVVVWTLSGGLIMGTQTAQGQIGVETNIVSALPLVGPSLRKLILGGNQIGHLANTHFYSAHVALLPIAVGLLALVHVWQVRRNRDAAPNGSGKGDGGEDSGIPYRPFQSIRNWIVFAIVLAAVAHAAWYWAPPLDMPADPEFEHIARPEWYFAFLFQLRHYFTGPEEVIATMGIPAAMLLLLVFLPLFDRWLPRSVSTAFRPVLALVCVGGWAVLTYIAFEADHADEEFLASRKQQAEWAARARNLADYQHIPPEGAISLLRRDAKTQGPRLFAKHCASCHSFVSLDGHDATGDIQAEDPSASNLFGFATRPWLAGLLDPERISGDHYFGKTAFVEGDMVEWVRENIEEMQADMDEEELVEFGTEIEDVVIAVSSEADLRSQKRLDEQDAERIQRGRTAINETFNCIECHKFRGDGELGDGPDLTGYGSRQWLVEFLSDPAHERFYSDSNDRMPSYAATGDPAAKLDRESIEQIVDWLRGEWFEPPQDVSQMASRMRKLPETAE